MQSPLIRAIAAAVLIGAGVTSALTQNVASDLDKTLPRYLNGFRRLSSVRVLRAAPQESNGKPALSVVKADYLSISGRRFTVELDWTHTDSEAYSLFTFALHKLQEDQPQEQISSGDVGTTSVLSPKHLLLFKGQNFLKITESSSESGRSEELLALARLLSASLDKGNGEIPVLIKHLPDWQNKQQQTLYVVDLNALRNATGNQTAFDALSFEGGAEAVVAPYENSQLVVIEFSTPQLAGDNDRRTSTKIKELWQTGQPAPTAYRRVGNYLVFVLNGQNEQSANQLIDQIKYEQIVQWLGENPYLLLEAQKQYAETTLGVFLAVVKASALALLLCFGIGGLFGGLLFSWRRAQQKAAEAYSDAGGMLRLNLDEMTPQTDPARLIGREN